MSDKRVLVVGDVMTDIVAVTEGELIKGSDRRASIRIKPGGGGANQAAWLSKLGINVALAARVGGADKEAFCAHFRQMNIIPELSTDAALPSGVLLDIVTPDGERSFLTDRSANLALSAGDLSARLLDGTQMLLLSGYAFIGESSRGAALSLLKAAKQRGVIIGIDPGSFAFLEEMGVDNFLHWTKGVQYFFPNEDEARVLTGSADTQEQMKALGQFYDHVIIKRGAEGAVYGNKNGATLSLPSPQVKVIDTTGAGDAFAAGFVAAIMKGAAMETCLRQAIETGALAVQMIGAQPEMRG